MNPVAVIVAKFNIQFVFKCLFLILCSIFIKKTVFLDTKLTLVFQKHPVWFIQGVSEIRVLILTSERTRQFMKLFSITFCKIRKSIPKFFAPQFVPNEFLFFVTMRI
jgi:hypothetical protein